VVALLAAGVLCAGVGTGLMVASSPARVAGFGWTAYSPLSSTAYRPIDPTWLIWVPRAGAALLALGAGTAGAALAALVLGRTRRTGAGVDQPG
jgi:heme/copper-type cytochrome/quinol oxidase subunit 1